MPTSRSATTAAALGDRIHVAGGEAPVLFAVHEVYDVAIDTWSCLEPMAIPRHGIAAVGLDDRILAPAGGIIQGLLPTSAVDSFIPPALGDLDGDGSVSTIDLLLLLSVWGPCPRPCPPTCPGDLDIDCQVSTADLLILLANWG